MNRIWKSLFWLIAVIWGAICGTVIGHWLVHLVRG